MRFQGRRLAAGLAVLTIPLFALLSAPSLTTAHVFTRPTTCDDVSAATTRGGGLVTDAARSGGSGCNPSPARQGQRVLVERVIDGDTIVLASGERVRYIGIDAPEVGDNAEPLGDEAMALNRTLVERRDAHLVAGMQDADRFGRLLRYVFVDGVLAEAELVREGLAEAREYQPDQPYALCTATLEDEAREKERGICLGEVAPSRLDTSSRPVLRSRRFLICHA